MGTRFNLDFVILYVNSPLESAYFYEDLLGVKPVEVSPTFALFALDSGVRFGLWSRHTVEPLADSGSPPGGAMGGRGELAMVLPDEAALRAVHAEWQARGLVMVQAPVHMDFGLTFVALDPDGHRLRVFA